MKGKCIKEGVEIMTLRKLQREEGKEVVLLPSDLCMMSYGKAIRR